jgi:hypothetical protein
MAQKAYIERQSITNYLIAGLGVKKLAISSFKTKTKIDEKIEIPHPKY